MKKHEIIYTPQGRKFIVDYTKVDEEYKKFKLFKDKWAYLTPNKEKYIQGNIDYLKLGSVTEDIFVEVDDDKHKCESCGEEKKDVKYVANPYVEDVHNETS